MISINKIIILLGASVALISCTNRGIIRKTQMTDILLEMHIADGVRSRSINMNKDELSRKDSAIVYGPIVAKYGYNMDDFNKSISYYSKRPEDLKDMYAVILKRMKDMRGEYAELSIQERKHNNLWNGPDSLYINSDSVFSKFDFNIPVKGVGTYILSADVNIGENDSTYNPRVAAWFEVEMFMDSIIGKQQRPLEKKQIACTLRVYLKDTSTAWLKGRFFDYDSISSSGRQHVEFKNIYVEYIEDKPIDIPKPDSLRKLENKPDIKLKQQQISKDVNTANP